MLKRTIDFVTKDIWQINLEDLPKNKSFLFKQIRIFVLAIRGFNEDKCTLRASALTFFSLLSIVPVIAMAFGIAKGFGFDQILENQIKKIFIGYPELAEKVMFFANSMLENTKGGLIAGIGFLFLLWAVIRVLSNIEESFNEIWQIKKSRTITRKLSDYLAIIIIAPFIVIISSSITVFLRSQITNILNYIGISETLGPVLFFFFKFFPYLLLWFLLTFIYLVLPNTKVNFKPAFLAGIIAGTIFQLTEWAYITFQVGVSNFNAIYGSFAALPLFLIWMRISWLIVLFGAELAFAFQNVKWYVYESEVENISVEHKKLICLLVMHKIIKNFIEGKNALNADEISKKLKIPLRLSHQILYDLEKSKLILRIESENVKMPCFCPATDINKYTISYVLSEIEKKGSNEIPVIESKEKEKIYEILCNFKKEMEKSNNNLLLKNIL